jgi:ATP-dependent protease ClpP protease subunit
MEVFENIVHTSDWMEIREKGTLNDFENAAKEVEIDINGVIGGSFWDEESEENINTKEKMKAELKYLAGLKAKKITVNIDSLGGSFAHAISIHDLLRISGAKIKTKLYGMSASAATLIAQAGDEREMSENALQLIHKSMINVMDSLNENKLKSYIKSVETVDRKIEDIYVNRGADREKIKSLLSENNGQGIWIDSKQAKEYGLIDNEFKPMKIAAMANVEILNKYKLPIPKQM